MVYLMQETIRKRVHDLPDTFSRVEEPSASLDMMFDVHKEMKEQFIRR